MEKFSEFIHKAFLIGSAFFIVGLLFGFAYSLNLLAIFCLHYSIRSQSQKCPHLVDALRICSFDALFFTVCADEKRTDP